MAEVGDVSQMLTACLRVDVVKHFEELIKKTILTKVNSRKRTYVTDNTLLHIDIETMNERNIDRQREDRQRS